MLHYTLRKPSSRGGSVLRTSTPIAAALSKRRYQVRCPQFDQLGRRFDQRSTGGLTSIDWRFDQHVIFLRVTSLGPVLFDRWQPGGWTSM